FLYFFDEFNTVHTFTKFNVEKTQSIRLALIEGTLGFCQSLQGVGAQSDFETNKLMLCRYTLLRSASGRSYHRDYITVRLKNILVRAGNSCLVLYDEYAIVPSLGGNCRRIIERLLE